MCGSWGAAQGRGRGEIRRLSRRALAIAFVTLFAAVPAALADDPTVPWSGGTSVETPFEQFADALASVVVGRPVTVSCNGANDWSTLGVQQRFDPVTVWGYVLFSWDSASAAYRPGDSMQLSEAACWYLDQYWQAPRADKGKQCRTATQITFVQRSSRVKATRRVKVQGRWQTRSVYVTHTKQVPVYTPRFGTCPDYQNRIFALQTISHESQHLAGTRDEAAAECNGMQMFAWFAQRFGATADQAREMAGDYFRDFYSVKRPGTPYYQSDCPDPSKR